VGGNLFGTLKKVHIFTVFFLSSTFIDTQTILQNSRHMIYTLFFLNELLGLMCVLTKINKNMDRLRKKNFLITSSAFQATSAHSFSKLFQAISQTFTICFLLPAAIVSAHWHQLGYQQHNVDAKSHVFRKICQKLICTTKKSSEPRKNHEEGRKN